MRLWLLIMAVCAMAAAAAITEEKLRSAQGDSGAWLMYGKNYSAWRYSDLSQINTGNVAKLAPRWIFQTGAGPLETTLTGSYDPDLNLIYWSTGSPVPDLDGVLRPGENPCT